MTMNRTDTYYRALLGYRKLVDEQRDCKLENKSVAVISAVGHETDFTICDFVSDMRAPTPSAAAELAVPEVRELCMLIDVLSDRCDRALIRIAERSRERLTRLSENKMLTDFSSYIQMLFERVCELSKNANAAFSASVADKKLEFLTNVGKLEALNPLSVLARGYSVIQRDGKTVLSVNDLEVEDSITVRLSDGSVCATVRSKNG